MSCHDIGRGMNSVAKVVIGLYDENKFDRNTARILLAACRNGVHWCDGNEDEAIASLRGCRCGKCLSVIKQGDKMFSVWDVSDDVPRRYQVLDSVIPALASDRLCESCFDEVMDDHCGIAGAGEREKKYIIEQYAEESYTSKGM